MRQLTTLLLVVAVTACAGAPPAADTGPDTEVAAQPSPEASASPSTGAPSIAPSAGDASPSPADVAASPSAEPTQPAPPPGRVEGLGPVADLSDSRLAELGVNELGRVVVAQWHVVGDTDGEYRTSRDTLRAQLQDLYDRGFAPVTQAELIAGTFPIPAGTSPLVLTFDDSTRDHLTFDDDGQPVADSVVGILESFAADKPSWRATAVFAYNFPDPFGDSTAPEKLRWLVDNGYELSNHTVGHTNLGSVSAAEAETNLADNYAQVLAAVPDASVPSITLPYGAHATDTDVERRGSADGVSYQHDLVYLVGSYPNRSPHHVDFDPGGVQRVPAHAVVGTGPEWFGEQLDWLDAEPLRRFVSDGDPDTVTYPAAMADVAAVRDATATRVY